ncbi:hypothetical protein OM076_32565 [Solirubrobacter ginsenosidimutans]|uniref:Uncharacterized protein n=1 Tax=Solirubrobacter ginsenosidimutans TaxID=490573 RepID=A0A9X3N0Z2_9ACTN|nr:hypothetical protein [Solirubrobacter ginsenosidimutans]MDA0165048.1 hypothetical protein [Solirubrobacter ginsenosidimutans]
MHAWVLVVVALAGVGCGGGSGRPRATASPSATKTPVAARASVPVVAGPWSAPVKARRTPLRCPVSSSRAGWPSRVLALGDGTYVKVWGRRPRLATVDARGHLLGQTELGARRVSGERALACGRGGQTAVAWTEYRRDGTAALKLARRGDAVTLDVVRGFYDDLPIGDVTLAFAPDGSLLVAYSIFHEVRAVVVAPSGDPGAPFKLGPAFEVTQVAAEIAANGRAVIAWTTIDAGEERNEHRRVYAVTGRLEALAPAQLVHRAAHLNAMAMTGQPGTELRLSVARNGRALLLWGLDHPEQFSESYSLWVAEAGPAGSFGRSRQLVGNGVPGDVAMRSDGTALAVWTNSAGLRASVHAPGRRFTAREPVLDGRIGEPRASFVDVRPRIAWENAFSVRAAP